MRDFTNSKIYFIRSPELPTYWYVGYTTAANLKDVLNTKRKDYKQYVEGNRKYETVFEILQYAVEFFDSKLQFRDVESKMDKLLGCDPIEI